MGTDETQVAQTPRPSGSGRPRLVLGLVLLILGVGDLLFINVVLLPQVLAVETASSSRPTVNSTPAEAPEAPTAVPKSAADRPASPSAPHASGTIALVPAEQPAATPPTPAAARPRGARPSPASAEPHAPAPVPSFAPLRFYRDSAWLSPESKRTLRQLAVLLKANPTLRVTLDGHTDELGPEPFNQELSMKRAWRARERLEDLGIARTRIDIKAYGSSQPADTEHTADARARNRRVEIELN